MSWLSDFTSKAENFLNKIDQTTGSALNESGLVLSTEAQEPQRIGEIDIVKETVHKTDTKKTPPITPISKTFDSTPSYRPPIKNQLNNSVDSKKSDIKVAPRQNVLAASTPGGTFMLPTRRVSINQSSTQIVHLGEIEESNLVRSNSTPSLKKKQDDLLFEFLNSNAPPTTKTHVRNLSGPKSSTPRKPLPQTLSTVTSTLKNPTYTLDDGYMKTVDVVDAPAITSEVKQPSTDTVPPSNPQDIEDRPVLIEKDKTVEDTKKVDQRISNLELENKLLKNEMQSLNEELASTLRNLKEQQQETEKFKRRYENRRTQQNADYERVQSQFESQVTDLQEALKAKDSQLAVLRVRIDDADAEVKAKTNTLDDLQKQHDMVLKDHSDATGVQSDALVNSRHKLEAVENQLRQEQLENSNMKSELLNLQSKLQNEQQQYAETIKQLQSRQSEGKDKSRELEVKTKAAADMAETTKQELKEYKEKAARILQAKEKLISSLRQGSDTSDISPAILSEIEELKQEKDMLRNELQQSKYKMQQLQSEFQDLELLHDSDTNDNQQKIESLQSSLQDECQKRKHAEEDMKRYMQELQFTRDDLKKVQKSQIADKQEHELELKKLNLQLNTKAKQTESSTQEELENRIRTLTNSLIQKQTMLEALGTEKNSLVLQLERLEKQYHDIQSSLTRRNKDHTTDIEDPESVSRLQPMASIMPSQITQNKHWKKTVNDIDKFSIRLGVFLRRYPIARLMIIFYVLLLHLWVTFVLLTYTPEMHSAEHHR